MWPNPQFPADLVTFIEKIFLMGKSIFCAVLPSVFEFNLQIISELIYLTPKI